MELPSTRFHWLVLLLYQCHLYQHIAISLIKQRPRESMRLTHQKDYPFEISETRTIIPEDINTFTK